MTRPTLFTSPNTAATSLYTKIVGLESLAGLLSGSDAEALARLEGRPLLARLDPDGAAQDRPARFIATLLHGNEDSGFRAVREWVAEHPPLSQPLWIFIGNVRAATERGLWGDRYLDDQEDFNRVWGIDPATTRMRLCAQQVFAEVTSQPLEAAIDIHNNTGDNPLYAILPEVNDAALGLAGALSSIGLLWGTQEHTLMQALTPLCPALAVECGRAGVDANVAVARQVIERFVGLERVPSGTKPQRLLAVDARVEVRPEVAFEFAAELTSELDFVITPELDAFNFDLLPADTKIGVTLPGSDAPLKVKNGSGRDLTQELVRVTPDGSVMMTRDVVPAMMTRDAAQTRRDCLFYTLTTVSQ